jgi:hypothetical protein
MRITLSAMAGLYRFLEPLDPVGGHPKKTRDHPRECSPIRAGITSDSNDLEGHVRQPKSLLVIARNGECVLELRTTGNSRKLSTAAFARA